MWAELAELIDPDTRRAAARRDTEGIHPMRLRRTLAATLAVGSLFLATACAGDDLDSDTEAADDSSAPAEGGGPVTIAGQSFPEAALVASMYEQLLADAGYEPTVKLVDSRDGYMPTFPDSVDVVPEYVGGIVNFLNAQENGADAEPFEAGDGQALADDGADLLDAAGITLLDLSAATDTNAFFVTQDYSDSEGVTTLSDLEGASVVLAAAQDCEGRLDCEGGLSDEYGIDVTEVLPLGYASDQTYQSVIDGESQLGETSTTDGTLEAQGLVVLEDDKQIQPAQNLVPAVSSAFLEEHPDVADVLNPLMAALTTDNLTELNGRVAVDREKPEDVALDFLQSEGLL
jgi:osmoprotectant transport system substrate-binding protein